MCALRGIAAAEEAATRRSE